MWAPSLSCLIFTREVEMFEPTPCYRAPQQARAKAKQGKGLASYTDGHSERDPMLREQGQLRAPQAGIPEEEGRLAFTLPSVMGD